MKNRRERQETGIFQLAMTPMVSVAFVVLMFFVFSLKQEDMLSGGDVIRPEVTSQQEREQDGIQMYVFLSGTGLFLQGRRTDVDELDRQFARVASYTRDVSVVIKCTAGSSHGLLLQVLDVCAKNRMKNLNMFGP